MKILLLPIDSKIPNLALKKIEKYHVDRGDEVIWHNRLLYGSVDKTYISVIFSWNRYKAEQFLNAEKGGSGWDLITNLPPEIEKVKPRINLGFTTRGCIRQCPFCIVPKKEGVLRIEGDIYDIWDGKTKLITLLDNNIFGLPEHFRLIVSQLRKEKLIVDFNQGLDHRLLSEYFVKELKSIKTSGIRFSFDHPSYMPTVEKAITLLNKYKICAMWYVLVGFNTSFTEDLERIEFLNKMKQRSYVMRYETCKKEKKYIALARWNNSPLWRNAMSFEQFCKKNNYHFEKEL